MTDKIMKRTIKLTAYACLLWSTAFFATAGTFTPEEGSTITSNTVVVSWVSDAQNQWVRAYGDAGAKIFDSGRLIQSAGSVQFAIANSETRLKIIFYEKAYGSGSWISVERLYPVEIDNSDDGSTGGSSSEETLASLTCSTDQIAKFNGSAWICANDNDTDFLNEAGCAPGDLLRATDSEGWECVSSADVTTKDDCPPLYSRELNIAEFFLEPSPDWTGNYTSASKNVTDSAAGWETRVCDVVWSYHPEDPDANTIRHTFRRNYAPNYDFSPEMDLESYFGAIISLHGLQHEVVVKYNEGSDGSAVSPLPDSSNETIHVMTQKQWAACGILAGCSADDF